MGFKHCPPFFIKYSHLNLLFHYSIKQFAINTFLISAPAIAQDFLEPVVVTGSRYKEFLKNTLIRTPNVDHF